MESASRRSAMCAVAVLGVLLLALSWYRLGAQLPTPFDCCECGSLRSPSIGLAVSATDTTVEAVLDESSFTNTALRTCETLYSSRASEVQVTAGLGGLLLAGGGVLASRRRGA